MLNIFYNVFIEERAERLFFKRKCGEEMHGAQKIHKKFTNFFRAQTML